MSSPLFSIIISTRNRASHLRPTLQSLAALQVVGGAELILADNGSSDQTRQVFEEESAALKNAGIEPRLVSEPRPGACRARNRALKAARGEIIFLTDDDVRVPKNWLQAMSAPLQNGHADAVAGGISLAPHLERDWFTPLQRGWLASTEEDKRLRPHQEPGRIISANMAFLKSILETVPGFDEELGPGALGFCDDILFSLQMKEAGLRLWAMWEIEAEHHFDESRLSYQSFTQRAATEGRSQAYFWYHWLHEPVRAPRLKLQIFSWQLAALQRREYSRCKGDAAREGCSEAEMLLLKKMHCYRQYLIERRRPRNYELRGLVKKDFIKKDSAADL